MTLRTLLTSLPLGLGLAVALAWPAVASAEEGDSRIAYPTELVERDDPEEIAGGSAVSPIIFLNDCKPDGCVINPGGTQDDARSDISSIPDEQSTVQPFAHPDATWDAVVQCVREVYGPYGVEIVTDDPGPETLHHEAIVGGVSSDVGLSNDILGIAVISSNCTPRNNVISYTFANMYSQNNPLEICATVAQESAHSFGLDHVYDCTDPMTYLGGCGQKFFRNKPMECGEFSVRPQCRCTGTVQNSHLQMLSVHGEGTLPPPPDVEILLPEDGSTVEVENYSIFASATDQRGVFEVDLAINGWVYDTKEGNGPTDQDTPYSFEAPSGLPEGVQRIEIRARNDLGVETIARVEVTRGTPCTGAESCLDGQTCDNGACIWPTPTGELGDACQRDMDCVSALCPSDGTNGYCSEFCFPSIPDQCPDGFDCLPSGNSGVCWPADGGGGGGCCSVGDDRGPSAGQLLLLFGVALLVVRRRRRA